MRDARVRPPGFGTMATERCGSSSSASGTIASSSSSSMRSVVDGSMSLPVCRPSAHRQRAGALIIRRANSGDDGEDGGGAAAADGERVCFFTCGAKKDTERKGRTDARTRRSCLAGVDAFAAALAACGRKTVPEALTCLLEQRPPRHGSGAFAAAAASAA